MSPIKSMCRALLLRSESCFCVCSLCPFLIYSQSYKYSQVVQRLIPHMFIQGEKPHSSWPLWLYSDLKQWICIDPTQILPRIWPVGVKIELHSLFVYESCLDVRCWSFWLPCFWYRAPVQRQAAYHSLIKLSMGELYIIPTPSLASPVSLPIPSLYSKSAKMPRNLLTDNICYSHVMVVSPYYSWHPTACQNIPSCAAWSDAIGDNARELFFSATNASHRLLLTTWTQAWLGAQYQATASILIFPWVWLNW